MKNSRAPDSAHPDGAAGTPPDERQATASTPDDNAGFVERMLSGFGHAADLPRPKTVAQAQPAYRPLRQSRAQPGVSYRLPGPPAATKVSADSPAIEVMTDLARVSAVTTTGSATLRQAREAMMTHRVRALFVTDDSGLVLGIVTSTDIGGEKPVLIAQQRALPPDEVPVRAVMTPTWLLESIEIGDVQRARVGDIVESLRACGRRHALVVETVRREEGSPTPVVRGIFSLTQIARSLGLPPQPEHDIARTFAEIESAIGP